jgi:[acyl-carrier-protein] S-malonyltransferase
MSGSIVAHVAGRPISLADLEAREADGARGPRARHLPPGDGPARAYARRWLVRELVTEALIARELAASDGDIDSLVRRVTATAVVAEDEARDYYARNPDRFRAPERRRIRHVVLPDETAARRLVDAGADGLERGDDMTVGRGELTGVLEEALFGAPVGATVGPIRTEHGWHVARIDAAEPASLATFDEVRPRIDAELLLAARRRTFEDWLERRRSELAVVMPEFEHPGNPAVGLPTHRH